MVVNGHSKDLGANPGGRLSGLSPRGSGRKLVRLQPVANRNWPSEFEISTLETGGHVAECGRRIFKHSKEATPDTENAAIFDEWVF